LVKRKVTRRRPARLGKGVALVRLWLLRGTLALGVGVALFLMITLVLPMDTMGDPVFDTALLRARWYTGWGVLAAHIAVTFGMAALAVTGGRRGWAIAALLAGLAAMTVLVVEESRMISYGALIGPPDAAALRLTISRWAAFVLQTLSLFALWNAHAKT
jgi:hypothetical protein